MEGCDKSGEVLWYSIPHVIVNNDSLTYLGTEE